MSDYQIKLTDIGLAKDNASTLPNGQPLDFYEIAVGDGTAAPDYTSNSLQNEVWRGPVSSITASTIDPSIIEVYGKIPKDVGGFYIRELAIFDQAGDMIALVKTGEQQRLDPAIGQLREEHIKLSTLVSNAANVTLLVDPSIIDASQAWVLNLLHPFALSNAVNIVGREIQKFKDHLQDALISKLQSGYISSDGSQEVIMNNYYTSAAFEYLKDAFHPIVFSRTATRSPGSDHAGISTLYPFVPSAEFRADGLRYNNYSTSQLGNVSASLYDRDGKFIVGAQDVHDLAKAQAGQGAVISFAETTLDANALYYIGFYYQTGSTMTHQYAGNISQILPYVDHLAATESSVFGTNGNAIPILVGATSFGQDVDISALDPTAIAPSINLHHAA